jgi:biopolymer transport protein TolR
MKKLKLSGRSKRMQHFKRMQGRGGLNLVSLMDIFTILVFFLLVNSGSQQLPSSKDMALPTSVAKKVPKETLVLAITHDAILLHGRKVMDINTALANKAAVLPDLKQALIDQLSRRVFIQVDKQQGHAITIMGDENIPYELLRKILATCRQANYTRIAFAAHQEAKSS